ncbi:MAG: DUF2628 domain-containing protein [Desulfobacteraceae bacterium]|jgi:hypothetical protein
MVEELQQKVEATERDFVNFVGENADKYLRKFKKFNVDGVDKFAWTWHWPAFFLGCWWLLYRKLYVWGLIGFFLVFIPFWFFVSFLVYGPIANYIYYKHAKKKIIKYKTRKAGVDPHKAAIALRYIGGGSGWGLLYPVILLILMGIAIPYFLPPMFINIPPAAKADLRNAATAQEAYFLDYQTYADSIDKLVNSECGLSIANGVTVVILKANSDSYEMTSFHELGKKRYTLIGPDGLIQETDLENERKEEDLLD